MSSVVYYLDTSALIKRYVAETGSRWIQETVDPQSGNLLLTSRLSIVEARSALARRRREASIDADDHAYLVGVFNDHCHAQYHLVEVEGDVVDKACDLLDKHSLRAYDAVQLASAVVMNASLIASGLPGLVFLCSDERLLAAAEAEGLKWHNPSNMDV